jgi:hypothetical protein
MSALTRSPITGRVELRGAVARATAQSRVGTAPDLTTQYSGVKAGPIRLLAGQSYSLTTGMVTA